MRTLKIALFAAFMVSPFTGNGQTPSADSTQSGAAPASTGPTAAVPGTPSAPSSLLRASLDNVQQSVTELNLQKWKRGTIRDEAGDHINAIHNDLQTTLPPLLEAADAAPGTVSKVLPVSRNVSALYDVLLSVVEAARVAAPGDQVGKLEQALSSLGSAQRALGEQLQQAAVDTEKQVVDLRGTISKKEMAEKTAPKPVIAAAPCVAPTTAHKPKRKTQPAVKHPTAPAPAKAQPTGTKPPPQ